MIWTKRTFNLILILALWLMAAQTAWAADETKTFTASSVTGSSGLLLYDGETFLSAVGQEKVGYDSNSNYINLRTPSSGKEGTIRFYPRISGKVKKLDFSQAEVIFTNDGSGYVKIGKGSDWTNSYTSSTSDFIQMTFTHTSGIQLENDDDYLEIKLYNPVKNCTFNIKGTITITYEPTASTQTHTHNFSYNAAGNTLTATCGGTDGLACSLTNHQISTSLTADDTYDSDPAMTFPATLTNFALFSTETGATKGNITYVNNTTGENLGTTTPSDPGQYTASITINAGGTNHTLTKTYNVYAYAQINNIYPQFNVSTDEYASATMAGEGQTVTITFTPKFGETLTGLTVTGATTNYSIGSGITDNGSNTYTFTMPAEEVTIGATFSISEDDFAETGTDEYTIKTANGWGWFCFTVNSGLAPDGFSGKTVKLDANVSSSEMAGTSGNPFKGTFDGQDNTLTVAYGNIDTPFSEQYAAPFRYMNGGAINNLHVTGTITTSAKYAAGIAGNQLGTVIIRNCRSSVTINSSVSGDGTHGGFVGTHSNTLTIEGCVFNGSLLGASTNCCGGFVGWRNGTLNITNSLFAPAEVTIDVANGNYPCCTFSRNGVSTITNCYYTTVLGKRQGRPATTAPNEPTNLGKATTDHGLVDGYENGLFYNGTYYTPKYGDVVVEYIVSNNSEHADVTINGEGNNLVGVNITEDVEMVSSVTYNRTFKSGKAATVILPFNYICNGYEGGKFYGFKEVTYDYDQHIWVCTMVEPGEEGTNNATSLTANMPYLFMPNDTEMTFPNISSMTGGVVTLLPTTANDGLYGGATTDVEWNFYGTYVKKTWTSSDSDTDYGFAATSGTAVHGEEVVAGQFVRFAPGAWMNPMRCYLSYVGTSAPAPARGMTRGAATDDLPASITVRLVSRNGDVDAIGTLNMETGEMSFEGWYTLDGVRLSGKPSTKGIYINNGKKVILK